MYRNSIIHLLYILYTLCIFCIPCILQNRKINRRNAKYRQNIVQIYVGGLASCDYVKYLLPESIQIDLLLNFGRLLIDFGYLLQFGSNCWCIYCCFGTPFSTDFQKCLLKSTTIKQGSDKSCQDQSRPNKINQQNAKHKPASAACRSPNECYTM